MTHTFSTTNQLENAVNFATISNLTSGGAIGTAADTTDVYQGAYVSQDTPGQTLSLPTPTGSAPKSFWLVNTGSVSFTIGQKVIFPGTSIMAIFSNISIPNQGEVWVYGSASATITTTTTTSE